MIKVAVVGAAGRMGTTVVRAVEAASDMEVVAALDMDDDVSVAVHAGADVAVDFTVPDATERNVLALIDAGIHSVVGTTGWTQEPLTRVRNALEARPELGVLIAPNFALGAVLAAKFAAQAAPFFESVEVVEYHHPDKEDAPSGTAAHTADLIAEARRQHGVAPSPDATRHDPDGSRGARIDDVHVHAVRLRGMLAHEEILLGNEGEVFTLRHDTSSRSAFMPGVLLGIRKVAHHPGLTVGLDTYLDV